MAEMILRQALGDTGNQSISVTSAGLAAVAGYPATVEVHQLMSDRGFDITAHRAIQLVPDMLLHADLVLVMENKQRQIAEQLQPAARGRVYLLGEWGGFEVADPYRQGMNAYKEALYLIDRGVSDWVERIK